MRTKIKSFVTLDNLSVRVDKFLELWASSDGRRRLENLPFKRDLRYWNNGPTSMQPKKTVACYQGDIEGENGICIGVYEIWERMDGWRMEFYKFDNIEDYQSYNPSGESPDAIKREIGLCVNYHKGV